MMIRKEIYILPNINTAILLALAPLPGKQLSNKMKVNEWIQTIASDAWLFHNYIFNNSYKYYL